MNLLAIIAQLAESHPALYTYGPMGVMLAWFMYHTKDIPKDIKTLAHRIDGLTRALLVDMAERDTCGLQTRRYAQEEIAKIEARMHGGK